MIKPQIFHISTSSRGGAGIAAINQHEALLNLGFKSHFLTLEESHIPKTESIFPIKRTFREIVLGKFFTILQQRYTQYTFFSTFSKPASALLHYLKAQEGSSKILQIHNWYNFFDLGWLPELQNLGYRILFTLHDERLLSGGCHYAGTCQQFMMRCQSCPLAPLVFRNSIARNKELIFDLLNKSGRIVLLAPSNWIAEEFKKASLPENIEMEIIPNYFPVMNSLNNRTTSIKPTNRLITVGIASVEPFAQIKGGAFLQKLMESEIALEFVFLRNVIGSKDKFWQTIDCLLVPSLQDNSPNVIHEAKIHGVPVIATRVGGIPEILSEKYDMAIEITISPSEFYSQLMVFFDKLHEIPNLQKEIRENYLKFSSTSLTRYLNLINIS